MFNQYFGQYLLNRAFITREQLMDALDLQNKVYVKFGVLAVDEGYMTSFQVEEVHEKQKQVDKRFGEVAVDCGYLTNEQVEVLVSKQKQNHLFLAQALVDRGYMTIEQFELALRDYKKENSLTDTQMEAMKSGNVEELVNHIVDVQDERIRAEYGKYVSLFVKNMIRFIDHQVYIDASSPEVSEQGKWLVYQEITGEHPLFTAMNVSDDVFVFLASKYAEEELAVVDELAKSSVSEFLNLQNGIYLVNMSNSGMELEMKPQEVLENAVVTGESFRVTVHTSKGPFQLILSTQPVNISFEVKNKSNQGAALR
ncbi:hypothetical protein [Bacillus sp. FJAT-49736]|uniref:hypothetical protein n=1 Tax=Bacillus sp. FJAT-49736 TaxID=2833582 RepID=UPI001BC8F72E|nr:hypothetical protein [Bacillus sp. FJAT-49736]MBS4175590.1 hypothetical protein [Bacillus sp. FJAT-49736]